MALALYDRVRETSTIVGTGTATLLGAVTGYQSFSVVGNGNTTYYCIVNTGTTEWEVGIGTYTASGTTLSRTTVLSSSNSGSLVSFTAGTKDVFVTYPAGYTAFATNNSTQSSGQALVSNGVGVGPTWQTITTTPSVPSGAVMLFYQSAAPSGWTQVTTQNNKAMRVVSGTGGTSGGTTAFSTVFTNQTPTITVGAYTLGTGDIPSHAHSTVGPQGPAQGGGGTNEAWYGTNSLVSSSGSTGGGGSHTHSGSSSAVTLNVQYIDIIICSKN